MSKDEALKLALEALEELQVRGVKQSMAITACRKALETKESEPFGYFKAEPFGWTDCAETDEGAIALYETPQAPAVQPVDTRLKVKLGTEHGLILNGQWFYFHPADDQSEVALTLHTGLTRQAIQKCKRDDEAAHGIKQKD